VSRIILYSADDYLEVSGSRESGLAQPELGLCRGAATANPFYVWFCHNSGNVRFTANQDRSTVSSMVRAPTQDPEATRESQTGQSAPCERIVRLAVYRGAFQKSLPTLASRGVSRYPNAENPPIYCSLIPSIYVHSCPPDTRYHLQV
jgi:hypothetical protein